MLPLPPAFVVSHARLAQFRAAWAAVGLPDCVAERRAGVCPSAPFHPATVAGSAAPPREEVRPCP